MKRRWRILTCIGVGLVAFAIWLYFTPHFAVSRMQRAAEKGDRVAFAKYVDFSTLSASLRTNISAALSAAIHSTNAQIAAFQKLLVKDTVDKAVNKALDEQLAPENLFRQVSGPAATNAAAEQTAFSKRYVDFRTFAVEQGNSRAILLRHGFATWKLSRIEGRIEIPKVNQRPH